MNGKVREAIEQSISRILVGADGSLTIEAEPGGLLGLDGNLASMEGQEGQALLAPRTLVIGDRQWTLIAAGVESRTASR